MNSTEIPTEEILDVIMDTTTNTTPDIEPILIGQSEEIELQLPEEEAIESLDKKGLHKKLVDLANLEIAQVSIKHLKALKNAFDHIISDEKERAQKQYIIDGGEEDGFEYKKDADSQNFEKLFYKIKENFDTHIRQLNKDKESNFKLKESILEKLRELVDAEDNAASLNQFKELQKEWRNIGQVAIEHNATLWANFNALVERFYDKRSIYFELKQLDRKKNAELKTELVEKAEKLLSEQSIGKALKELNDIHQEYKLIGPAPDDIKDILWDKLKAVTHTLYDKRKEHLKLETEHQLANLAVKKDILTQVETWSSGVYENPDAWKNATKQIQELEDRWKQVKNIPREETKDLNKRFWNSIKKFFNEKNTFFKNYEAILEEKLAGKKILIEKAEALRESTDWDKATLEIIRLQKEWKNSPNFPSKKDRQYYESFKKACDHFFGRKRDALQAVENELKGNVAKKDSIAVKLETAVKEKVSFTAEEITSFISEWEESGEIPSEERGKLNNRYIHGIEDVVSQSDKIDAAAKAKIKLDFRLKMSKNSPDLLKKLKDKEFTIKKRIRSLEDELDTFNNNLQFFARAKNFASLKAEYDAKMAVIKNEIDELKEEAKLYRDIR